MKHSAQWIDIGVITADRSLEAGENITVSLVDSTSQAALETIQLTPSSAELGLLQWPRAFADYINGHSTYLRAGIQNADGSFSPQPNIDANRLWTQAGTDRHVICTGCRISDWKDIQTISSIGSLPKGTTITCTLKNAGVLYDIVECSPEEDQSGRYSWPVQLSRAINRHGGLMRAGEKDDEAKNFVVLGSSFRNRIWCPAAGSTLDVELNFKMSADALKSAAQTYDAVCSQSLRPSPGQAVINQWFASLVEGKFQDLNYPTSDRPVSNENIVVLTSHLDRLVQLASYLYRQPSVSKDLVTKVLQGLNFYAAQDYQTCNWWHRQIGLAKPMCRAAVLLAKHLDAAELMLTVIPNAMKNTTTYAHTQTGANLADFASIQIMWSICAWKNSGSEDYLLYLRAAADALSGLCLPISRNGKERGEGICVDYSFSQHNVTFQGRNHLQLYSGSYGPELVGRIVESMVALKGDFFLDINALAELINFIVKGVGWTGYAKHIDYHTCGRAISRQQAKLNAAHANWARAVMPYADDANKEILSELITRVDGDESQNRYYRGGKNFWVNDYMSFIGEKFCLWAKAISTRTVGGEGGNQENPKGYYMGAGTYFLTRHGKEYEGIEPVWDYQRLPGTTVEQVPNFSWPNIDWGKNMWGSHDFAGGVSDGKRCVLSMELSRQNVTHAYKTVMALGNQVMCIGTRINSQGATHPVITSVNQCIAIGPVRYMDIKGVIYTLDVGDSVIKDDIHQVHHDGFIYKFYRGVPGPKITVQLKVQAGKWSDVNTGGSTETVQYPVFSMWVNHEKKENGSYIYNIIAADDFTSTPSRASPSLEADDLHLWTDGTAVMASCFKVDPGSQLAQDETPLLLPDQPCSYIYDVEAATLVLTCSDPTQTLSSLSFFNPLDDAGNPAAPLKVALPEGDDKGRSVTVSVPLN
jgi:chondroitin AC lyase